MKFKIFTDGASRGNPGPGGWGAIVSTESVVQELGGREKGSTNNRMELMAVIEALNFVSKPKTKNLDAEIMIFTDSSYVLRGGTRWIFAWQENGWRTKQKKDVLNKDLWVKLFNLIQNKEIEWKLLPGHSGIPANERCDEIATGFAMGNKIALYSGALFDYEVNLETETKNKKKPSKKTKTGKTYSYVSSVNGLIKIHKTWKDCEGRVKGESGALFKKSFSPEDEKNIILKWKKYSRV